jgi:hypothetical protein
MASILPDPAAGDINCIQFNPQYRDRVNARQKPGPEGRQKPGPEEVRIRGPRLTLRPLRPDEIDDEWRAMVTADPMAVAELPDEAAFRARLRRSGRMHDGWLDLAIDLDGTSLGRIQTFVPPRSAAEARRPHRRPERHPPELHAVSAASLLNAPAKLHTV